VLDGQGEGLRDVVGVHMVHQVSAQAGDGQLRPGGQGLPDARVEVAHRVDHRPTGSTDVAGVQRGGDQTARLGLSLQETRDGGLLHPVVAERLGGVVLGDRHLQADAVPPDGPAVNQMTDPTA
jgi:hypothetical protein